MADLEQRALKRDRSYVVRLVGLMIVAVVLAIIQFSELSGDRFGTCLAKAYLGRGATGMDVPQSGPDAQSDTSAK